MKLEDILKIKNLTNLLIYVLLFLIGGNFYLLKSNYKNIKENNLFNKLKEINYFNDNKNPYTNAIKLQIHPTNYFSIQRKSNNILNSNSSVYTLNEYSYRKNPYNKFLGERKKCIFFTGSSTAFGVGVTSDSKTIPAQIHKILGDQYLIYNLSIPSWNSRQELISIMDFLNSSVSSNCKNISSISFSGTADINNIIFSRKSKLFNNPEEKNLLINSSEQFSILEKKLDKLKIIESNIKYNFRIIFSKIYQTLFGSLNDLFKNKIDKLISNNKIFKEDEINPSDMEFVNNKAKAFLNNQILINNLITDLGGKHMVFIQPDLKNFKLKENNWNYINKTFSDQLNNNNCLNIVDMRSYLIKEQKKYYLNEKIKPLSLKDSIQKKLFKKEDIDFHYYYDNSHLTDRGSLEIAKFISENFTKTENFNKKCNLIKN